MTAGEQVAARCCLSLVPGPGETPPVFAVRAPECRRTQCTRPGAVRCDAKSPSCHHRCRVRGPHSRRGSPPVRRLPGLGQPPGRPVPGRGRSRVRAAVPAAEDLTRRDQSRGRRPDRPAPQGTLRPGPGRRPGHDRLASASPAPGHGLASDRQPVPDPARRRHPPAAQAAQVLLHPVRRSDAEPVLAVRLHALPPASTGTEILSWLDDHARYALSVTAHARVSGPIVVDTFRAAVALHGAPASTLTDTPSPHDPAHARRATPKVM